MSNKYVKITANQQQFSDSLNLVDFTIPEGYNCDLSKSKVLITVNPSITQPTGTLPGDDGLPCAFEVAFQVEDGGAKDLAPPTSAVLVREAFMRSAKTGMIENLRRVDILRTGLANYEKDIDEKRSMWHNCLKPVSSANGSRASCVVNYNNTGSDLSTQIPSTQISVPLNEIFDVANAESYSTDKYGQTVFHFRMNFNHLKAVALNTKTQGNADVPKLDSSAFASFETQTSSANGTTITTATSNKATNNPESDFPFYVGQRVKINATIGTAGPADFFRRVKEISYDNSTGFSTLTFNNSLGVINNTETCTFNSITAGEPAGLSYSIDNMELELKLTDEEPSDKIQYTTYSTEEDSFANITTKLKTYQVEPEADNLLVALTNGSIYPRNKFDSYRIRVDNVDMSLNDVKTSDPEHRDNINKLFLNMDLELKDVSENALSQQKSKDKNDDLNKTLCFVGTPLPMTPNMKQVNLKLSKAGTNEIVLFKRMVKEI